MERGRFITIEGGEGAGKSTQIRRLASRLGSDGQEVVTTREPGGSAGAEMIRDLIVRGDTDRWSPTTETLLLYAARRDHIERVIEPALGRGAIVLCDRFHDSTRAYQGAAGAVDPALIALLEAHVLSGLKPDLTLILDLPVDIGLARAMARGEGEGRFEAKGAPFHERLRAAFLEIAAREPQRCAVVAADGEPDVVAARIAEAVRERLAL